MNILILSWRDPDHPNAGGAEQVTLEHAKGWVEKGHDVYWFSSVIYGEKKEKIFAGVKIVRRGGQTFGSKIAAVFWYFFGKHPKFDLVIDQFHGIPYFTPLYIKSKKLAFIHEVTKDVWKLNTWPKPFNLIPAYIGTYLEPFVFKLFYRNIPFWTVSESTKNELIQWGIPKKNVYVIHNGVLLSKVKKSLTKETKKTAMFLGAISEDKGIKDAINVFSEINRKDEDWQFWIVGKSSPEYKDLVQEMLGGHELKDKTTFYGFVSESKKFELLAKTHVLINPSHREGWCLVNIEAASAGTPVLGYKVSGMKDSVKDGQTGILSEKGDYRSIAYNAIKLVNDKTEYKQMQDNSIKWSKNFSWEKAKKESLELIESI